VCCSEQAPVLPAVKRNVMARVSLYLFNEVASIHCLPVGIRLCIMFQGFFGGPVGPKDSVVLIFVFLVTMAIDI